MVYLFPSVNVENRTDAIWVLIAEVMVAEAGEEFGRRFSNSRSQFGKNGEEATVPLLTRRNDCFRILERKGTGHLYGVTELNCWIQTGSRTVGG